jgi:RNA polymerase sigma-70 factor (ECF subfamily)
MAHNGSSTQLAQRGDTESQQWLRRLRSAGADRERAIAELHAMLLRAAGFEVNRRRAALSRLRPGDIEDLAQQSADDAIVAVLAKLDSFRGDSRFTTWAYKFALYETAANVRKLAWQGREIPLADEGWRVLADRVPATGRTIEMTELLATLSEEIEHALSPHQREVMVALALNEVPIDVLAERLNTTRGALYKTLHDARQKLRARLAARGMDPLDHGEAG